MIYVLWQYELYESLPAPPTAGLDCKTEHVEVNPAIKVREILSWKKQHYQQPSNEKTTHPSFVNNSLHDKYK